MSEEFLQSDLFPVSGIPKWLPDETLFSLCSRYHVLSGNQLASTTCQQLFGHSQFGTAHDFPSQVREFATRTRYELGTAEAIILRRSLLSYYLPFRSAADQADAMSAMQGRGIGSLKFRLGILTSRFRANHPLKACSECMREDQRDFGSAYWRLTHQLPGTLICIRHNSLLLSSTEKSTGVGRFLWLLPTSDRLQRISRPAQLADSQISSLIELAHSAHQLAQLPRGFHFKPASILDTYHAALTSQGLMTQGGVMKNAAIGASYFHTTRSLLGMEEYGTTPGTETAASVQVLRLLRPARTGTHPLRHLLVIHWLFGTWSKFWRQYIEIEKGTALATPPSSSLDNFPRHDRQREARNEIVRLVVDEKQSVRSAAKHLGIDVSTAMIRLAETGVSTKRRPKKLKADLRRNLIADLQSGMDKNTAATTHHVSPSTVMKILRQEPGLYQVWLATREKAAVQSARDIWNAICALYPHSGVKQLRAKEPKTYAWLYRNDRIWLVQANNATPRASTGHRSSVDWSARDRELSQKIQVASEKLLDRSQNKKLALWSLYQEVPELKAKLSVLHRLPLTKQVIDKALALDESDELNYPDRLF